MHFLTKNKKNGSIVVVYLSFFMKTRISSAWDQFKSIVVGFMVAMGILVGVYAAGDLITFSGPQDVWHNAPPTVIVNFNPTPWGEGMTCKGDEEPPPQV